ncbi:HupE/UreJ family protein [Parvularcula sp. SM1705]|uniref:HupE/UreJ family protein n=1 Tax=Parvularcula marina TaxID=2292771 RepID=A0A371RI77_9PROT|nr:HupE/UreJ family protein [Parvularcula marina]
MILHWRLYFLLPLIIAICGTASAHEVRPAYLELREIELGTYDILWKTPARGDLRLALNVILPDSCITTSPHRTVPVEAAVIERWRTICEGGLQGQTIRIENLETSLTDVILRVEPLEGAASTLRLDGATPSLVIPQKQSGWAVAHSYFDLGVEHILLGFDHLLFVLCLLLLVRNVRRLIGAVTAFTVAHSITLAATTLGLVHLAIGPVEALIALSIAFLAAEIIRVHKGQTGATARWPWIASFGFGLLHGFGFASVLAEIGLPGEALPVALLFFNIGVEAGQLLFVGAVLLVMLLLRQFSSRLPEWSWRAAPYTAGSIAMFWFIERTAGIIF